MKSTAVQHRCFTCKEFWLQPYEDAMMPADVPACEGWKEGGNKQNSCVCVCTALSSGQSVEGGEGLT